MPTEARNQGAATMRYQETKEYSAELLRMILPLMSAHEAPFHPMSYTVWYEYVSGINPELTRVMDSMLEKSTTLGDKHIQELFRLHILERDEVEAQRFQGELHRLMEELTEQAVVTGRDAEKYGKELDDYSGKLRNGVDEVAFSPAGAPALRPCGRRSW